LVTLDDDVELTEGWLVALLDIADDDVGIVGCVHLNSRSRAHGTIRHAGGWIGLDGMPKHHIAEIAEPIAVPYVCSACMLINDTSLRFSLEYEKYFQEAELCLESWQRGEKVLISPHRVYHYGQGQMEALGLKRDEILAQSAVDRATFCRRWIENDRLKLLYARIRDQVGIELPS
jgi:GT2 family glycosyltransferase